MLSQVTAVRLVGVAYILAVGLWFTLEGSAASRYFPHYSFAANMISDLGVPYMYFGELHLLEWSPLSWLMNLNFFVTACLYAGPQWLLLFATNGEGQYDRHLRSARAVLSAMFLVGLILVGIVHGGPREHSDGSIGQHQLGATFSILGGNLCSILAGSSAAQIRPLVTDLPYRVACIFLGVLGLGCVTALVTITPHSQAGTVERLSVYTIFAWQLMTGITLLIAAEKVTNKVKTK